VLIFAGADTGRKRRMHVPGMEEAMRRFLPAVLALALSVSAAQAERAALDGEGGRYTFHPVSDGVLRLDTRTGQVSLCGKRAAGWACEAVPDERQALENEIARLQSQNAALKRELIARGLPLPGDVKPDDGRGEPRTRLKLPSDEEVDRVMTFLERVWRRFLEMMRTMEKEQKG
jgi:hypothetical protein